MGSGSSVSNPASHNGSQQSYNGNSNPNNRNVVNNPINIVPQNSLPPNFNSMRTMNNFLAMNNGTRAMTSHLGQSQPHAGNPTVLVPTHNPSRTIVMNADIAIRKKTLKLDHIKKNEFYLSFYYDCVKEIEISIFMFIEEKEDFSLLTKDLVCVYKPKPIPPFIQIFPAGKNMHFSESFVINFDQYPQNFFFDNKKNYYPVIIKMRKNPIQAPEEKKSLFHYIGFHTEEKEIKIKFLRQKLEQNGNAYEIQEIYGINYSNVSKEETNVAEY